MKYISDINDKVDKNRKEKITPAGKMNREHSSFKTSFPIVHCWYMRYGTNSKSSCYTVTYVYTAHVTSNLHKLHL